MDSDTPAGESGEFDAVNAFEGALGKAFGEPDPKAPPTELDVEAARQQKAAEEDTREGKTYRVKVDGREIEVPEDELLKGYSRQQDYTKKTMELAAHRQQVEQVAAQIQNERAGYQAQLNQMAAALGQQLEQQPDWQNLLKTDPVAYLEQRHLYEQRHAAFQQAQQAQAQYAQMTRAQQAQSAQQQLEQEREQLIANLPAWKDDAKAQTEKKALASHLIERGYTQEQIAQLTDHRTVIMAREAMLYRQMMSKATATAKQVEKLPPRMERPGVTRPTDGRTVDMQALKKSGKTEDAAALFAKML